MPLGLKRFVLLFTAANGAFACQRPKVADPGTVVSAYAHAVERGDSEAVYALLSRRSQRELGREGTRQLLTDGKRELLLQSKSLNHSDLKLEALARVRYEDGEVAELELEQGVFRVSSAAALPSAARSPADALSDLRRALARRSYVALVRVLSEDTRSALESDLSAIVRGLENPESLEVNVQNDEAEVELSGGHVVKLKREGGVWRVEDIR